MFHKGVDKLIHAGTIGEWSRNKAGGGVEGGGVGEENIPRSGSTGERSVATEPGCFGLPQNS